MSSTSRRESVWAKTCLLYVGFPEPLVHKSSLVQALLCYQRTDEGRSVLQTITMDNIKSQRLTDEVRRLLSTSITLENINPEVVSDNNGTSLFIKLNASPISIHSPVYKAESTMFGKALRLITVLDKKHKLRGFIRSNQVNNIIVGDNFNITHPTKDNIFILDAPSLSKLLSDLDMMGVTDELYELSLKFAIDQNR